MIKFKIDGKVPDLQNILKSSKHDAFLGIFKDNSARADGSANNNAMILATHVFGSISQGIPKRDPLIEPLHRNKAKIVSFFSEKFNENLKNFDKNKKDALDNIIIQTLNQLAFFVLEDVVKGEILTNGQGTWPALSERTVRKKFGSTQALIDTKEMFDKLDFKVK